MARREIRRILKQVVRLLCFCAVIFASNLHIPRSACGTAFLLTVAKHHYAAAASPRSSLSVASAILQSDDGVCYDNVSCVNLYQDGSTGDFIINDSYNVILGDAQLAEVQNRNNVNYDIKLVDQLWNVGGYSGRVRGITILGTANTVLEIVALDNSWAHEFGHMKGLVHYDDCSYLVMNTYESPDNIAVTPGQSLIFQQYSSGISSYSGPPCGTLVGNTFAATGGPARVTLTWGESTPSSGNVYELRRSDSCWGPFEVIGSVVGWDPVFTSDGSQYTYVDSTTSYQRNYYYQLVTSLENLSAFASPSTGAPVSPPGVPGTLAVRGSYRQDGVGTVALTWGASSGSVTGYHIYRKVYGGLSDCRVFGYGYLGISSSSAYQDTTAPAVGVPISYRVRAFNSTGGSDVSNEAIVQPTTITFRMRSSPADAFAYDNGSLINTGSGTYAVACTTFTASSVRGLSVDPAQTIAGTRYCFDTWSDGGRRTHTVNLVSDSTITLNLVPSGSGPTTIAPNGVLYDDAYDCKSPYVLQGSTTLTTSSPTDTFRTWGTINFRFPHARGSDARAILSVIRPVKATAVTFETVDSTSVPGQTNLWGGLRVNRNGSVFLNGCTIRNSDFGIANSDLCYGFPTVSVQGSTFESNRSSDVNVWLDATRTPSASIIGNSFHGEKAIQIAVASTSLSPVATATISNNFFYTAPSGNQGFGAVDIKGAWQGGVTGNTFTVGQNGAIGLLLNQGPGSCAFGSGVYGSPSVLVYNNRFSIVAGQGRYALRTAVGPVTQIDARVNDWSYYDATSIASVIYDRWDDPARAEAIFEPFTVPPGGGGGGGCPYVLVRTEAGFTEDNTLLADSELPGAPGSLVRDTYPLRDLQPDGKGRIGLRIAEWEQEITRLDHIGLIAVSRPDGLDMAADPAGRLVLFRPSGAELDIVHASGQSATGSSARFTSYRGVSGDSLELRVIDSTVVQVASRGGRGLGVSFRPKPTTGRSPGPTGLVGLTIRISPDTDGDRWISTGPLVPRENWSTVVVPFDDLGVSAPRRIRIVWHSAHTVGWAGIVEAWPATDVVSLQCVDARHSNGRSVRTELGAEDGSAVTLRPGEHIDFEFDASKVPARSVYALQARGRYDHSALALATPGTEVVPTSYSFKPLGPNPFNPETSFELRVPHQDLVTIRIFDITGRLVRVLLDGPLGPGIHTVRWDGTDERGRRLASGIYFLALEASDFSDKHRLVILR